MGSSVELRSGCCLRANTDGLPICHTSVTGSACVLALYSVNAWPQYVRDRAHEPPASDPQREAENAVSHLPESCRRPWLRGVPVKLLPAAEGWYLIMRAADQKRG